MSDQLFHIIEDAQVILYSRGVYKQAKLYQRAGQIFAAWGGGYVRLLGNKNTTRPDVSYVAADLPSSVVVTYALDKVFKLA